jgi:hypothetical protein
LREKKILTLEFATFDRVAPTWARDLFCCFGHMFIFFLYFSLNFLGTVDSINQLVWEIDFQVQLFMSVTLKN